MRDKIAPQHKECTLIVAPKPTLAGLAFVFQKTMELNPARLIMTKQKCTAVIDKADKFMTQLIWLPVDINYASNYASNSFKPRNLQVAFTEWLKHGQ